MHSLSPETVGGLRAWIGRSESRGDIITAAPLTGLAAVLDRPHERDPAPGSPMPPLAHWLYFLPSALQGELGTDGHAKRGGFLPPVPLPRRMWAGGRLRFLRDLAVGSEAERRSTIVAVDAKQGRSGALVFVTVRHDISDAHGLALSEEHDIVYRDEPGGNAPVSDPPAARTDETFSREIAPDPVLLFRYSALTFNGHRIHYDRDYAREVECYPGLVVHGPLVATLLVDLMRRALPGVRLRDFSFKAIAPLFDIHRFTVCGRQEADGAVSLWARDREGFLAMQARAEPA